MHFYGNIVLYNIIATHLPCKLQILHLTYPSLLNHTIPTMQYHNIFTNFALIHKRTSLLHFHGKTALYNIIAAYFPCKLQILHPPHFSSLTNTIPIMKYNNIFPKLALIHKRTLLLHFRGKTTLYNIIATHLPCKLQMLRCTHTSSLNYTTPILKYDNLFPNFALIYKTDLTIAFLW